MQSLLLLWLVSWIFLSMPARAHDDEGELGAFFHEATPEEQSKYGRRGWEKGLPSAGSLQPGYLRTIMHLHNVYSHDACDGDPQPGGRPNQKCFEDLRSALCELRVDIAFMTEHATHMGLHPFEETLNIQNGDAPIMEDGHVTGVIRYCDNGHKIHVYMGTENALMSFGLTRHIEPLPGQAQVDTYQDREAEAILRYQAAGALAGVAHSEDREKPVDYIAGLGADFMEIYNLHAEFLMLLHEGNRLRNIGKLLGFLGFSFNVFNEPDLFIEPIQSENTFALSKWASIVQKQHITGIAGSDAHRNVLKAKTFDGERLDSYRRTLRAYSNYVYASRPEDRASVLQAVREGRTMTVFEMYGSPSGFEFSGSSGAATAEMGGTLTTSENFTLKIKMPKLVLGGKSKHEPKLRARLLKAEGDQWREVASSGADAIEYTSRGPGVYRAEVRVRPKHLTKYLANPLRWNKEHVWIYSNPIWVSEP